MPLIPNGDLEALFKLVNGNLDQQNFTDRLRQNADFIKSGSIDATEVTLKNLDASKITSGSIDATEVTLKNLNADNITSGKIRSKDGKTYFDLDGDKLVMYDGANNRVVMNGTSMKVSQAGYDADTTTDDKLVMSSEFNTFKITPIITGTITTGGVAVSYTDTKTHDLGYKPMAFASVISSADSTLRTLPTGFIGFGGTYQEMGAFMQLIDITNTTISIKLDILSLLGLSQFGANGVTFNYKIYLVRETAG
jgi:hypothetical protein